MYVGPSFSQKANYFASTAVQQSEKPASEGMIYLLPCTEPEVKPRTIELAS
jgi:hypothetical protein